MPAPLYCGLGALNCSRCRHSLGHTGSFDSGGANNIWHRASDVSRRLETRATARPRWSGDWLVGERGIEPHVKLIDNAERTDGRIPSSALAASSVAVADKCRKT